MWESGAVGVLANGQLVPGSVATARLRLVVHPAGRAEIANERQRCRASLPVVCRSLAIGADGDAATGASERGRARASERERERESERGRARARDAELSRESETGDAAMATISMTTTSTTTSTATAMATEPRKSYQELCRLCASYDAVRMHIFGQEGQNRQLVDKIQTCLPFKVSLLFVRDVILFLVGLAFDLFLSLFPCLPRRPLFFLSSSISFTFLNHLPPYSLALHDSSSISFSR